MPQVTGRKPTLILKGCPKCGRDLSLAYDMHGKYLSCLQCGLLKDVRDPSLEVTKDLVEDPAARQAA